MVASVTALRDVEICEQQAVARIQAYCTTRAQMDSSLEWKVTRLARGESLRAEGAGSKSVAIFRDPNQRRYSDETLEVDS